MRFCGPLATVLPNYCPHKQARGAIIHLFNDTPCRSIARLETSFQGFSVARSGCKYGLDYAVSRRLSRTTMVACSTPNHRLSWSCLELTGDLPAPLSGLVVNFGYLAIPPIWRGEGLDFVVFKHLLWTTLVGCSTPQPSIEPLIPRDGRRPLKLSNLGEELFLANTGSSLLATFWLSIALDITMDI